MLTALAQKLENPQLIDSVRNISSGEYINRLIPALINILFIISIVAFILLLLIGGTQWILSGGNKQSLENARNKIVNAITGLLILLLLWIIIQMVNRVFGINLGGLGIGSQGGGGSGAAVCQTHCGSVGQTYWCGVSNPPSGCVNDGLYDCTSPLADCYCCASVPSPIPTPTVFIVNNLIVGSTTTLGSVFSQSSRYPGYEKLTLYQAMSLSGGSGELGAFEILLRAASRAYIIALDLESRGAVTGSGGVFSYSSAQVVNLTNSAIPQGRDSMLIQAANFDQAVSVFNSNISSYREPLPVVNNSATGLSCNAFCLSQGFSACNAISSGNVHIDWNFESYGSVFCPQNPGTCATVMDNLGQICTRSGYPSEHAFCWCIK